MVEAVAALLLKKELTYGTDAVPTAAANAVLIRNFSASPIEVDRLERPLDRGVWGAQPSKSTNERQTLSFEIELAGSGAPGTAPRWMEVLEGCGMGVPVPVAATDVTQRFGSVSAAQSSLSSRHYMANQLRKGVGARGTWSLDMTAGAVPFFGINLTALIPAATPFATAALGVADFSSWKEPLEVCTANTAILLDGYAAAVRSLRIEANVNTNLRSLVGARYVNRGNHAAQFTLVIEAPELAVKDYISLLRSGAFVGFSVTHGTVAGNIIEITAPRAQIATIAESKEDDKLMWTITGPLTVDQAGDELLIRAR